MKVREIIAAKGARVTTVLPQGSVRTALRTMALEDIGALVVSADGRHIDGIVSERDVCRRLATSGEGLLEARVVDVMTRDVITCHEDDSIKDLMAVMTRRRVRHLPVVEHGVLHGIVSIGDIVKHRLEEVEMEAMILRDMYVARS